MCNSCYNYQNYCCTSPAKLNYPAVTTRCCKYQPPLCHREVGRFDKCKCCQEIGCSRKGLLHDLCPVPGMRGETVKKVLKITTQARPCSNVRCHSAAIPLLHAHSEAGALKAFNARNDGFPKGLSDQLRVYTSLEEKVLKVKQRSQFHKLVKQMNSWYTKEMKEAQKRNIEKYIPIASAATKSKKRHHKALDNSNFSLINITYTKSFIMTPQDFQLNYTPAPPPAEDVPAVQTNDKQAEVDDHVAAMAEMLALLKEAQNNPSLPIHYYPPFARDNIWSWKDFNSPLLSYKNAKENSVVARKNAKSYNVAPKDEKDKPLTPNFSQWSMDIIKNMLHNKPVTNTKLKTNKKSRKSGMK